MHEKIETVTYQSINASGQKFVVIYISLKYKKNVLFCLHQTSMVSVEGLTKLVDPSQLTADLDGTLEYDHVEWTELRVSLEEFTYGALHLLSRLEELQETISRQETAADTEEARRLLEEHARLRKNATKAPVDELEQEGQRLLQKIRDGGDGRLSGGPDFQSLVPRVAALLDKLQAARQHLLQAWHMRKQQLDQCFQLRLYEQDAEKVSILEEVIICCEPPYSKPPCSYTIMN